MAPSRTVWTVSSWSARRVTLLFEERRGREGEMMGEKEEGASQHARSMVKIHSKSPRNPCGASCKAAGVGWVRTQRCLIDSLQTTVFNAKHGTKQSSGTTDYYNLARQHVRPSR